MDPHFNFDGVVQLFREIHLLKIDDFSIISFNFVGISVQILKMKLAFINNYNFLG